MGENPSDTSLDNSAAPKPEALQTQAASSSEAPVAPEASKVANTPRRSGGGSYRPSHKATFIGLSVVVLILAVNAGVIVLLMRTQQDAKSKADESVTLSPATLSNLGVSRSPVGNLGTELVVGPKARFNGSVTIGGDISIAGQFQLKKKLSAATASITDLQAGDTSLSELTVNGDATANNFTARQGLTVAGASRLQGAVTISNNLTVAGNLVVGGTFSSRSFQANSLTSGSTLTIGGHIITQGSAPSVGAGGGVGSNGTVSISGNDASGTVAVNVGTGGGNGLLAQVAFRTQYGSIPHVVVSPVSRSPGSYYVTRTVGGFSIYTSSALSSGGYAFDYIVMQ